MCRIRGAALSIAVLLMFSITPVSNANGLLQASKAKLAARLKNNPLVGKTFLAFIGLSALLLISAEPSEVLARDVARNTEQIMQLSPDIKMKRNDANAQLLQAVRTVRHRFAP